MIEYVDDRKGICHAIDFSKAQELGGSLKLISRKAWQTVEWYKNNEGWWKK